jgi:hypothetical protein
MSSSSRDSIVFKSIYSNSLSPLLERINSPNRVYVSNCYLGGSNGTGHDSGLNYKLYDASESSITTPIYGTHNFSDLLNGVGTLNNSLSFTTAGGDNISLTGNGFEAVAGSYPMISSFKSAPWSGYTSYDVTTVDLALTATVDDSTSGGGSSEPTLYGGLTVEEIGAKVPALEGKSASNGIIDLTSDSFDAELVSKEEFNTEADKRARLRQAVLTLKQRAVAAGLTLGSSNRMRVPRSSLAFSSVFSKDFFQVADNNVEVNLSDLNGDGIYAPLENSGDYLKVNTETEGSYVTITNAGDGTFTLTIDGTETTGVAEGTTGTHDGFRYYVGSGSGEPLADPICFVKGTLIPMADGSKKPIEDIQVGE